MMLKNNIQRLYFDLKALQKELICEIMSLKSCKTHNLTQTNWKPFPKNFGTFYHFDATPTTNHIMYHREEIGDFLPNTNHGCVL